MKPLIRMLRKEAGQALPMALILLFLGAAIIIPTLYFTTTNLKATEVVDQKTRDIYAADAGIDDGLWKVRYNYLPDKLLGKWTDATYNQTYTYVMHDSDDPGDTVPINDRNVEVEIKPIWVLEGLEDQSLQQGRTPDDRLLTYGSLTGESADKTKGIYTISISYDNTLGTLMIQCIGCWLPPGFEYVSGSSNLEKASGQLRCVPQISNHNGGKKITWDYPSGINYNSLLSEGNRKVVTFEFTPNEDPTDAFSWTRTTNPTIKLSWDTSKKIFKIDSKAPSDSEKQTTIVSHSIKKEFQALSGAITGDYQATGITLMRNHNNTSGDNDERERLYKETPATITTIPNDATVEKIYLYWSGWKCKPWCAWKLTDAQLNALPVQKYVNRVALKVKVGQVELNTNTVYATAPPQVMRNGISSSQHGWSYSCFADITDLVKDYFKGQGVPFYGNATYTVGHWDLGTQSTTRRYRLYNWTANHNGEDTNNSYTQYPLGSPMNGTPPASCSTLDTGTTENTGSEDQWSYAAWSVVVIYSSPSTAGHHLYHFDQFLYCDNDQTLNFTIKGFLAPEVESDPAARMTCFVGEGDSIWPRDYLKVNNVSLPTLPDGVNPQNNVWNSMSNVLGGAGVDGVDIDTFPVSVASHIIRPGDTQAAVSMPTDDDSWNLIYIILSFSSEITTGGVIDYSIR
jgi:hypothetical protein